MHHEPSEDRRQASEIVEDLELDEATSDGVSGGAADFYLKTDGIQGESTGSTSKKMDTHVQIPLT